MESLDFFSQNNRFLGGIISPWEYATWILQHADEMEPLLNETEWDLYLNLESFAAEFTSGAISEETFRSVTTGYLAPLPAVSHR